MFDPAQLSVTISDAAPLQWTHAVKTALHTGTLQRGETVDVVDREVDAPLERRMTVEDG